MALVAGLTVELVILHIIVLIGQVIGVVVLVAIDATEGRETSRRSVAFTAFVPLALVFSTVNREIIVVVLGEVFSLPARLRIVAKGTVHREACHFVVGVGRLLEIRQVACGASMRSTSVAIGMASGTVHVVVRSRE